MLALVIICVVAVIFGGVMRVTPGGDGYASLAFALCVVFFIAVGSFFVATYSPGYESGAGAQGAIGPIIYPFAIFLVGSPSVVAGYFTTNAIIARMNSWE